MSTGATVRDATLEVMRRFGMTTIFGNPGSTEIPFLTDLPSDIRFVLGAARGLGRRHGHRVRDRARAAVVRQPAHGPGPRERHQRHRQRPRLRRSPGHRRRPAGSAPAGLRAVPNRARPRAAGGREPGVLNAPGSRPGRSRRDRPRLPRGAHPSGTGARGRTPERLARARGRARGGHAGCGRSLARRRAGGARSACRLRRGISIAGVRGGCRQRQPRGLGRDGGAGRARSRARVAGVVRAPRRLSAGPPAVRRIPALAAAADAADPVAPRPRRGRRHRRLPALPPRRVRACWSNPGHKSPYSPRTTRRPTGALASSR